jgi:DHA2 family multidrug resistance protein
MLGDQTVANLMGQNAAPVAAGLDATVTRQAVTIGYIDDFKVMTVISIILLPLVFLLRPPRRRAATPAAASHAAME